MKYQIDDIDRKILSYLVKNARVPFLEIARECGISGAAIHQRVKKMEDAGIIEGSRFIVKPRALGFKICAFIGVILDNASQYKKVVKEIEKIPEVIECHFITGGKERNIDFLSSGERKGRSLNCGACTAGLRTAISYTQSYQNGIGKAGQRG